MRCRVTSRKTLLGSRRGLGDAGSYPFHYDDYGVYRKTEREEILRSLMKMSCGYPCFLKPISAIGAHRTRCLMEYTPLHDVLENRECRKKQGDHVVEVLLGCVMANAAYGGLVLRTAAVGRCSRAVPLHGCANCLKCIDDYKLIGS